MDIGEWGNRGQGTEITKKFEVPEAKAVGHVIPGTEPGGPWINFS